MAASSGRASNFLIMVSFLRLGVQVYDGAWPSRLAGGSPKPVVEADPTDMRVGAGHERAVIEFDAEVESVGIGHHFTRVAELFQVAGHEFVERNAIRPRDFHHAVQGGRQRD